MRYMSEVNVTKLLQDRQNLFIETRTNIENEVNKFLKSLEGLDHDVKSMCGVQEGLTAKDLLPALWVEPFVKNTYLEQKAAFDKYVEGVKTVCDRLNQEAIECLNS